MTGPSPSGSEEQRKARATRRWPNDKPDDHRSPFERDRDRILYSSAFRRLAGVTQVVSALEGHVYHNRLTHTLKVAQVSRRLAEKLLNSAQPAVAGGASAPLLDADVAEAAACAHDLGHPPFGHVAEVELQECMKNVDHKNSFEGNAQSFRIVAKTAAMDREFVGLNLTRATLNAVLKYPWLHDAEDEKAKAKWGAYTAELDDFRFARGLDGPAHIAIPSPVTSGGQSLEASIMDWADDITYAIHDAEDHYRAGLVPLEHMIPGSPEMTDFVAWVDDRWRARRGPNVARSDIAKSAEVISLLFGSDRPYEGTQEQRIALRSFTSALVGRYVGATKIAPPASGAGDWQLVVEPWARKEVNVLKELAWRFVIERPALAAQQHGQRAIIRNVFHAFQDATDSNSTVSKSILPIRTLNLIEASRAMGLDDAAFRGRAVCDSICAMTEDEIVRLHARLAGNSMGSVLDAIV